MLPNWAYKLESSSIFVLDYFGYELGKRYRPILYLWYLPFLMCFFRSMKLNKPAMNMLLLCNMKVESFMRILHWTTLNNEIPPLFAFLFNKTIILFWAYVPGFPCSFSFALLTAFLHIWNGKLVRKNVPHTYDLSINVHCAFIVMCCIRAQ